MIIAYLKLRKRNLGPILDANGWAVNARARMNIPFGASLTQVAAVPASAHLDRMTDPFADKKSPWPRLILAAIILLFIYTALNKMGFIYQWTHGRLGEPRPTQAPVAPTAPAAPQSPANPAASQAKPVEAPAKAAESPK